MSAVIQLDSGKISGLPGKDLTSMVYRGIPYAAPPVGDLRWKPPQPVAPWTGIKTAASFGYSAMQTPQEPFMMWSEEFIISQKTYSEDCLTLNVWTDTSSTNQKKPVLVFIHGGALISGGSSCAVYFGDEIVKKRGGLCFHQLSAGPLWLFGPSRIEPGITQSSFG